MRLTLRKCRQCDVLRLSQRLRNDDATSPDRGQQRRAAAATDAATATEAAAATDAAPQRRAPDRSADDEGRQRSRPRAIS